MSRDYVRQRLANNQSNLSTLSPISVQGWERNGGTAHVNKDVYCKDVDSDVAIISSLSPASANHISPVSPANAPTIWTRKLVDAEHDNSRGMDPAHKQLVVQHHVATSPKTAEERFRRLLRNPFELQYGRRHLRDLTYPLPVDLPELHRQNLRTLLACSVFGSPICSPNVLSRPPMRVLEVGCGSAFWSSSCHKLFSSMGYDHIKYTGLDIAPLAPDLRRQGLNWTFIQHDIRRCPWPFDDESFDYIMCKDLSMAIPLGAPSQQVQNECIRLLRSGGTLEIWESDHITRSVMPHKLSSSDDHEQQVAEETATFPMSPSMPFGPAHNKYLKAANKWIGDALGDRRLPPTPCARIAPMLLQEPDSLGNVGFRRVAIPLGKIKWEREARIEALTEQGRSNALRRSRLNTDQLALRQTALLTVVQMIEALEPILKEASGKNSDEWSYWWASMMSSFSSSEQSPLNGGECLEMGAWWATKRDSVD